MKAPADLHPDDRDARIELRDLLIARRRQIGISQAALASRAGLTQPSIARFEVTQPWRIRAAQRIAHALNARVVFYPDGLPGGPYDDRVMDMFRPADLDRANGWDQEQLLKAMTTARRACGVTQAVLAEALGLSENALGNFERTTDTGLMFPTVQRYCRALGGVLAIELEHLDEMAVAA